MNTRRAIRWLIEPDQSDTTNEYYDLKHGHRLVMTGQPLPAVLRHVRRNRVPGESVHQMDGDFQVQDITRTFDLAPGPVANPRRTRFGFTFWR